MASNTEIINELRKSYAIDAVACAILPLAAPNCFANKSRNCFVRPRTPIDEAQETLHIIVPGTELSRTRFRRQSQALAQRRIVEVKEAGL